MNILPEEGQRQREALVSNIVQSLQSAYTLESGRIHFYEPQLVELLKTTLDEFIELEKSIKK